MSDIVESEERLTYARWRQALADNRLLGQRCQNCDHETAAPKAACATCGSRNLNTIELPDDGTIYSVTTIYIPPEGFERPYNIGLVSVGNARVTARINGEAAIGDEVVFDDAIDTGTGTSPVFVPAEE